MNFDSLSIVGPALLAGLLVLATTCRSVARCSSRGIIFIDLAVAQMAGLGVIAADGFGLERTASRRKSPRSRRRSRGLAALVDRRRFGKVQEAIIGVSFVLAATGGMLLLANDPHGGEELRDFSSARSCSSTAHARAGRGAGRARARELAARDADVRPRGFYLLFAISVTASVQLVGVYLVFASLMVPALATRSLRKHALAAGYAIGLVGYLVGLLLSAVFDLPTGAVIVWTLTVAALASAPLLGRFERGTPSRRRTPEERARALRSLARHGSRRSSLGRVCDTGASHALAREYVELGSVLRRGNKKNELRHRRPATRVVVAGPVDRLRRLRSRARAACLHERADRPEFPDRRLRQLRRQRAAGPIGRARQRECSYRRARGRLRALSADRKMSSKIDVGLSHACLDGSADYQGQHLARNVCGWSDARARWSVNFFGAPALAPKEFASYRQNLVIGASLQLGVPVGEFDPARLINIGANRWTAKPEIGLSKMLGHRWTVDLALAGTFFETNDDFYGGHRRAQDPVYSFQAHAVRTLPKGFWLAVDGTRYRGGRTVTDGFADQNLQSNDRLGLTVGVPINRRQSLKFYYSTGVVTRTGTDFDTVGGAWQYRWGGGF